MAYLTAEEAYKAGRDDFSQVMQEILAIRLERGTNPPSKEIFAVKAAALWKARIDRGELPPLTEG